MATRRTKLKLYTQAIIYINKKESGRCIEILFYESKFTPSFSSKFVLPKIFNENKKKKEKMNQQNKLLKRKRMNLSGKILRKTMRQIANENAKQKCALCNRLF